MRSRLVIFFTLLAVLAGCGTIFALKYQRIVRSIKKPGDAVLTCSLYGIGVSDKVTQKLIYTCYVAGFLDAVQMQAADPKTSKKFIRDYKGMTLGQIAEAMNKFYLDNPQHRKEKPADLLLNKKILVGSP